MGDRHLSLDATGWGILEDSLVRVRRPPLKSFKAWVTGATEDGLLALRDEEMRRHHARPGDVVVVRPTPRDLDRRRAALAATSGTSKSRRGTAFEPRKDSSSPRAGR